MRAIFLSLILLNGLFAAYTLTLPSEPTPPEINNEVTADQLKLVNEMDQSQLQRRRLPVITDPPMEKSSLVVITTDKTNTSGTKKNVCHVLGPYKNMMDVRQARSRATGQALAASIRRIQVPAKVPIEYWVFIPPRDDRQSAIAMFKKLQANSFDSFLMTRGKNVNAISLGIFRNHGSARRLLRKAIAQGFPAEIQVMEKYRYEYWLELASDSTAATEQQTRIRAADRQVQWQPMACSKT